MLDFIKAATGICELHLPANDSHHQIDFMNPCFCNYCGTIRDLHIIYKSPIPPPHVVTKTGMVFFKE
jgi:hypothetical protein